MAKLRISILRKPNFSGMRQTVIWRLDVPSQIFVHHSLFRHKPYPANGPDISYLAEGLIQKGQ